MAELKTFLFTDVCGSVRLKSEMTGRSVTERDMAFIQTVLTPHRMRIEAHLKAMGGRVVSTAGDGHFLVFDNTIQAAQWAVAVQESHRDEKISTPNGEGVEVRISIHVGVPQVDPADPDNFVGKSVDYAARLNDYATGGQILVSRSVMAILDDVGLEGLQLHLHGRRNLKGIGNVEVHELIYEEVGPRPMRNQPKSSSDRQWTVIPTMGFEGDDTHREGGVAVGASLKQVGNYQLEEQLGAGGMGDVYKARHKQFGRVRAVKVIKPQYVGRGHGEIVRRFYNEIKAVGKLEHKNIVVAIDSSAPTDDVHYLVMEYIEGVGLDELVAQHGPLSVANACEIARQAARGLQYIHKHDMVHRDIKPSNLMLTLVDADQLHSDSSVPQHPDAERGVVKILDLGLALLAEDGADRLTRYDNKAMGTGMYMSPEQWRTTSVDIRADIYSLGCTLYHFLAGNPPYYDSDLRPEKAHEKEPLPPIRSSAQVPRKLWDVLRRMLAKNPADRFETPADVAVALQPFVEGCDLPALVHSFKNADAETKSFSRTQAESPSKVDTWWSRVRTGASTYYPTRRWLLGTGIPLLVVAGIVGGGAAYWSSQRSERDREEAAQERQRIATEAFEEAQARAQATLPAFARTAAEKSLPGEIAKRFRILTDAARNQELLELMRVRQKGEQGESDQFDVKIEDWVKNLAHDYGEQVNPDSWFINDATGIQVARSPFSSKTIGRNYRKRDYFHGLGRNLNDPKEIAAAKPIEQPHLSAVYVSSSSGNLKVAFSVPIRDVEQQNEVLGVLAMSVSVADFDIIEDKYAGENQVVLIDLRSDWLKETRVDGKLVAEECQGLILHHPEQKRGGLVRISRELLAEIQGANPLTASAFDSHRHFLSDYSDPLAPNKKFWGAFEPVEYDLGDAADEGGGQTKRIGWIVLVQTEMAKRSPE